MGEGDQRHAPATFPRERPGTQCIGGWVCMGAENLVPTGIRPPDMKDSSVLFNYSEYGSKLL
jgi:hypothetical protein